MPAPTAILDLVARFGEHIDAYKSGSYNETQLRRDFLDPFFKELGWDIDNTAGYDEAYRDVIHEDQVKVGGAMKAPDYGFRIGGTRKFFLEAKKPSVRIKDDISPAYQLRRYAWSAKLPLSILSDFEEFAIYDTRIKPQPNDPASKARIFYCRFDEYAEQWDFISGTFSREAILKGSFDKFAAASKGKRGTAEVDADFLATIEGWRADLARNLALRNPALTQRELNFAVQRILDRIIFLRICEDRGIEDYERLKRATEAKAIYPELVKLFQQADDRYNSGLFHFRSEKGRHEEHDTLTPHLVIDDKLLKGIVTSLYYPASPYEFSVLSADILGQVYEQFLGKVITLSSGHRAQVEDKPEVKKAGGVFYTPTYIVDYIVRQTVGPLVEGKTPKQIEKLTVLDPACGSGSFLIGAYQFLLDWYHRFYTTHEPETHAKGKAPKLVAASGGGWALTTNERKRILLTHIYGVDIDSQAVEVTKLSLLLKVLEGETAQTVQRELIQERVLPDLGDNIKCGNSLIASDFYAQPDLPELDTEAHLRLNVFDWDGKDGFPEIMKRGGFDAVIGNPPYVRPHNLAQIEKEYFWKTYSTFTHKSDLYCCFIERAVNLMRKDGRFSFIVSHGWLRLNSFQELRKFMLAACRIEELVELPFRVFENADVITGIFVLERAASNARHNISIIRGEENDGIVVFRPKSQIAQAQFQRTFQNVFDLSITSETEAVKERMRTGVSVGERFDIRFGLKTADDEKFLHHTNGLHKEDKPLLRGDDIKRYASHYKGEFVWYVPAEMRKNKSTARPGDPGRFEQPKVLVKDTSTDFGCTYDDTGIYVKDVLIVTPKQEAAHKYDLRFVTGVLNSRLMHFYYRTTFPTLHVQNEELGSLPLPKISEADQAAHDRIVKLVEQMLKLHQDRAAAKTPHEQTALDRQITATDKQIDQEVYALYGLTPEEIDLIEQSA